MASELCSWPGMFLGGLLLPTVLVVARFVNFLMPESQDHCMRFLQLWFLSGFNRCSLFVSVNHMVDIDCFHTLFFPPGYLWYSTLSWLLWECSLACQPRYYMVAMTFDTTSSREYVCAFAAIFAIFVWIESSKGLCYLAIPSSLSNLWMIILAQHLGSEKSTGLG